MDGYSIQRFSLNEMKFTLYLETIGHSIFVGCGSCSSYNNENQILVQRRDISSTVLYYIHVLNIRGDIDFNV